MTTAFIPDSGTYFYIEACNFSSSSIEIDGETTVSVRHNDRSHECEVFSCVTRDDNMIVALLHYSSNTYYAQRPIWTFKINKWKFTPVGPEVLSVLKNDSKWIETGVV